MTTRAEEIAAKEYPPGCSPDAVIGITVDQIARLAFVNGYKQGQQDRWIPVTRILPSAADAVDGDVLTLSPTQTNILPWQRLHEPMCPVTHWAPLPPNPEQR